MLGFIHLLFQVYSYILLIRILLSWVRVSPYHPTWGPIIRFIYEVTEPVLAPVRNLIPAMGGLDISPILVFFGLSFLERIVLNILIQMGVT